MGTKRTRPPEKTGAAAATSGRRDIDEASCRGRRGRLPTLGVLLLLLLAVLLATDRLLAVPHAFARRALASHDLESARVWVERSRILSPRNPTTPLLAARIARRQGAMEEMRHQLQLALRQGGDPQDVRREEVLALAQSGLLGAVESELIAWMAEPGAEADEISDAYANGLAAMARFPEAAAILGAWREDYPRDPRPDFRLGRLREHLEDREQAAEHYRAALARQPQYFPAAFSLGRVLLHQRQAEEALVYFRICLEMPFPLAAQVEMAACYKALGRPEEARRLLEAVLQADGELLAASYRSMEEYPDRFVAASELGSLQSDAGDYEEAEKWLRIALERNPRDLVARYALAITLRGLGRQDEAEVEFEQVRVARRALEAANPLRDRIGRDEQDLEARYQLGDLLLTHESQRMGIFWIRSILQYDSEYLPAHRLLAAHYRQRASQSPQYAQLADHHQRVTERLQGTED